MVSHFSPPQYEAGTQNWKIAQSPTTGWIYAANNYGLLEFDGDDWQLQGIRNSTVLRSILIGENDKIYVGGSNEFGVFCREDYDERSYHVLSDRVPDSYQPFGEVWNIHQADNNLLYFQTRRHIFAMDSVGNLQNVITPGAVIYSSLLKEQNLYLATDLGIYLYTGGRLHRLPGDIRPGMTIAAMAEWGDSILIATDFDGLYIYDLEEVRPWRTQVDTELRQNQLYSLAIDDNHIALGTVSHGITIIDEYGCMVRQLSRQQGLQNPTILSLLYDRDHNLWVGEDLGIDHVSLLWPTEFLEMQEPCGVGYAYCETQSHIYFGTNRGLYCETESGEQMVENTAGQVWRLTEWGDILFCCHNRGLFSVIDNRATLLPIPEGVWNVLIADDTHALACSYNGLYLIRRSGNDLQVVRRLDGYSETMFRSEIDQWGNIWTIGSRGVVRLTPNSDFTSVAKTIALATTNRSNFALVKIADDLIVTSDTALMLATEEGKLQKWRNDAILPSSKCYSIVRHTPFGEIAVSPGCVQMGSRILFDKENFFVGGFDNVAVSRDSTWIIVGGTDGYYRINLPLALGKLPQNPWKKREYQVIIPWYQTWWAISLFALSGIMIISLIFALIIYIIHQRDERLSMDKKEEIHNQQMRILQLEHDKAKYELDEKGRQLNNALLGRVQRNEILSWIQSDLRRIADALQAGDNELAKKLVMQTEAKVSARNRQQDKDWKNFEESFDSLNPEFVMSLREKHPNLNEQEVKLCVYILQGLQTKEIGPLLHLSTRGVEMMRYRMHSKMDLPTNTNLRKYFQELTK